MNVRAFLGRLSLIFNGPCSPCSPRTFVNTFSAAHFFRHFFVSLLFIRIFFFILNPFYVLRCFSVYTFFLAEQEDHRLEFFGTWMTQ